MKSDSPFRGRVKLSADNEPAAAKAEPTKKKGITATIIDGPDGEIVHMEQGERYSRAEAKKDRAKVTIRHGEPPKPPKKGDKHIEPYEDVKTTELHLKPSQLAGLKVGDKVSIHLKKH